MSKTARILWLHTQPEHYFNRLIESLNNASDLEFVVAYMRDVNSSKMELPRPRNATAVALRPNARFKPGRHYHWRNIHVDWRADLYPLNYQALILSGYTAGGATIRQVMRDCRTRGIPYAIFSDSNLRGERGGGVRREVKRCLKRRFLAPIIRNCDALLTANRLGVAYWRYYGAPKEKIIRCPYYADYDRIAAAAALPRAEVLGPFGIDPGSKMILTGARLVPVKGLDLMLRAFLESDLPQRGWVYAIAGVGPLEGELKAMAGAQLGKAVRFLGFVQPKDLLALNHQAGLFVLPSRYEPHGIVIQESLAAGTPVLASHVCGAAFDLVEEGRSGWLFRSGSLADLQRVLREATADEGRLAAMRTSSRAVFEEWFAETDPVRVVDELAHRLLKAAGPGGPRAG